jgi:F-type H+-transporting ATPase subunit gamma
MANLKTIRRRITSVRNTQKITRAMKMVAAAKLRRAQDAVESFRDYADLTSSILAEVASESEKAEHPLLKRREEKNVVTIVLCSDRGLCGGFNSNVCREVYKRINEAETKPEISIIGRKAVEFFKVRDIQPKKVYYDIFDSLNYETAAQIARELAGQYAAGEIDQVDFAYNEFVSIVSQKPVFRTLLPISLPQRNEEQVSDVAGPVGFVFEPGKEELLSVLLPRYVEVQVYRALVESIAAEHAARMSAMDAATNNAGEMLDSLTLSYNRARQSAITNDLMDIVGGAEALNG